MKYKLKLNYTEGELKELKQLSEDYHNTPIVALWQVAGVAGGYDLFRNLREKYSAIGHEDEFNFMADINNVVMGTAIFPEKKYVVHDKVTDQYIYYTALQGNLRWGDLKPCAEKKTKKEWLAINPAYESMLEDVEDDKVEEENE